MEHRWNQRLTSFGKALLQLNDAVAISKSRELNNLEKQGLIQAFEFTHELAWKLMQDFFVFQGNTEIRGSRDATRQAFKEGLISEGETWMTMIQNRNLTSHTYNEQIADKILNNILNDFHPLFVGFHRKMESIEEEE